MTSTLAIAFGFSNAVAMVKIGTDERSRHAPSATPWSSQLQLGWWWGLLLVLVGLLGGCRDLLPVVPRQIVQQQTWAIASGDRVAGQVVTGGLGDISVQLRGIRLRAPFSGQVELASQGFHCIYFSTPEVPAYLFRYCGVRQPRLGSVEAGAVIGRGQIIHFATLRRQPDGAWAIVEPSDRVLEQSLNQPSPTLRF